MVNVKLSSAAAPSSVVTALDRIRIVLVRPRGAGNIGAVARAMKNMGAGDLTLVGPARRRHLGARALAVHAADVLERARRVPALADAVADCGLVIGTTARGGPYRAHAHSPREAAPGVVRRAATQRVALVFGPEDHGLTNEELKLCHQLLTIPASCAYTSLNLAQAVMLCLYELFAAATSASATASPVELAPAGRVEFMYERLKEALLAIGFLHGDNPDHIMFALRRLFGRAGLEERDVRILLGMARQIEWFAGGGWRVAERKGTAGQRLK